VALNAAERATPSTPQSTDVLVVGSGPAGLTVAAALSENGLRVTNLAPDPHAPWPSTYGVWLDEIEPLGYAPYLSHVWRDTVADFGRGEVALGRAYGRFDNAALQAQLLKRCEQNGVTWHRGTAAHAEHTGAGSHLFTTDGARYAARLIVDASGHFSRLTARPPRNPAFQTAFGVFGSFSAPLLKPGQMLLMDFRDDFLTPDERRTPTFLYAMDLGNGRFLAEETSLAHRPGLPMEKLKGRLERRLAARGVTVTETLGLERVRFPMDQPLPDLAQRVVGFGGAAGMVHPASGYLVASLLRRAPELAEAVAQALGQPGASPAEAAHAAWGALWPRERLRARQLYLFGLEALLKLDSAQTRDFFSAFFKLPAPLWQGYLSGTLDAGGIVRAMTATFRHASNRVRLPLMRTAFGSEGARLLRVLRAP
jgi:lycopene beta-cyclase